jgi:hypothetical protein
MSRGADVYRRRRLQGLCGHCGRPPAPGRKLCAVALERLRSAAADASARSRSARESSAVELCLHCRRPDRPVPPGRRWCDPCRESNRRRSAEYRRRGGPAPAPRHEPAPAPPPRPAIWRRVWCGAGVGWCRVLVVFDGT